MAKKGMGRLAGLAALGALGYMALKGKGEAAPVETKDFGSGVDPDMLRRAEEQGKILDGGDKVLGGSTQRAPDLPAGRRKEVARPSAQAVGPDERYMAGEDPRGTPDRRGLSEAASMAKNYKPRRGDPGTLDLRGTSEASRMQEYYRPRRGRAPEVTSEEIEQAKKTAGQPFFSEKGLTPMAPYVMAPGKRYKQGGSVKKMASGGMTTSSASKRADGIAQKGKTRGKMC